METHSLENRMESFFLAETVKYLYLLFDEDNFIHKDDGTAEVLHRGESTCVLSSGSFVFNTEAHPFDLSAVQCCSADHKVAHSFLKSIRDKLNVPFMLGLSKDSDNLSSRHRRKNRRASQVKSDETIPPVVSQDSPGEQNVTIGSRTRAEYCACDIPLFLYRRVCVRDILDWLFYSTACPARFCPMTRMNLPLLPLVEFEPYEEVVLGEPDLLSCTTFDHRFLVYGELNARH